MAYLKIDSWLSNLPDTVEGIKIRVGTRRSLPLIAVVALPGFTSEAEERLKDVSAIRVDERSEFLDIIEEEAEAAGYPTELHVMRLHAIDASGRVKRSLQLAGQKMAQKSSTDSVVAQLVDGILKSNAELRKSVDILTGSLAHREDVLKDSIESMLEAQQHAVETEASSLLNMIESAIPAEPQNDPLRQQAAGILGQIGQLFTGGPQGPLTSDSLAEMMEANPEMVKEMLKSDRVKAAFTSAMSNNGVDP
jgi:hypothetical protein